MKRIMSVFVIALLSVALLACGKKEFAHDGTFIAFEESVHSNNAGMVTWVEVVVKDGKIESFNIDALQGKIVDGKHVWNEKSKKELGYDYRMHGPGMNDADYKAMLEAEGLLEWFEQANLIEAEFLANGVGSIDGLTDVTIKDGGYSSLAAKAVENAKAGIYTAFEESVHSNNAAMLTWVEITVDNKGKIKEYNIDALQGKIDEDGKNVWNEKSKKELGYGYRMHGPGMNDDDYKALLESEGLLEWFEQANLIEAHFLENGVTDSLDGITGVTIKDG